MPATTKRHRLGIVAGSLLTAALLAGCGAGTDYPTTDVGDLTTTTTSTATTEAPASSAPGGTTASELPTVAHPIAPRTVAPHVVIHHAAPRHAAPHPVIAAAAAPAATSCPPADYRNSSGRCVPRPVHAAGPPQGATAQCKDGTYSFSQHRSGTCSGHGGVSRWL